MRIILQSTYEMDLEDLYPDLTLEELQELTEDQIKIGIEYFLEGNGDVLVDNVQITFEKD